MNENFHSIYDGASEECRGSEPLIVHSSRMSKALSFPAKFTDIDNCHQQKRFGFWNFDDECGKSAEVEMGRLRCR